MAAEETAEARKLAPGLADDIIAAQDDESWPLRPWILSVWLAFCALMVDLFWDNVSPRSQDSLGGSVAAFFYFGGLATAFALEQRRLVWSLAFGAIAGLVMAGIAWWVIGYNEYGDYWNLSFAAGTFALLISVPLFQTLRDNPPQSPRALPYEKLHFYSWSDVVIGLVALAFVGLSWLLLFLISGLFELIGIDLLKQLTAKSWFGWLFSGASFGAALGILRENARILGTLQKVALIILSILAPFLAAALVIFLLSLPVTGLAGLWEATSDTTPILISCAVAAVILSNAVIRNNAQQASASVLLRVSAIALALTVLPLAVIAAVSTGLRIDQHGLTPERIWALLVVAIGTAYGLAYLMCVLLGRASWAERIRPANVRLSIALCGIALLLAMPFVDFGAMSARDQLARLEAGAVSEEQFDYFALANDFGAEGRAAARLMAKGEGAQAKKAQLALTTKSRYRWREPSVTKQTSDEFLEKLRLIPANQPLSVEAIAVLQRDFTCTNDKCSVIWRNPGHFVFVFQRCDGCALVRSEYQLQNDRWQRFYGRGGDRHKGPIGDDSEIEIRKVTREQIFVDGKPVGDALYPE